jgi:hypothetical protein
MKRMFPSIVPFSLNLNVMSSRTELGPCTKMYPQPPEDWEHVEFREGYDGRFIPVDDTSEFRELIVTVSFLALNYVLPCSSCVCGVQPAEDSPAVINQDNPRGYATQDIWSSHPTIKWRSPPAI